MELDTHRIRQIVLAQAGDRQALDELFTFLQRPLFRYIRSLVADESFAEDILQEVFVLIYRKLDWLDEPAVFLPWCYRIASREAFRRLKRIRGRNEMELDEASMGASFQTEPVEANFDASDLIERAPPAARPVLALHYLEDFSIEEVGGILGIPAGTVKSRLAYGLKVLREKSKT